MKTGVQRGDDNTSLCIPEKAIEKNSFIFLEGSSCNVLYNLLDMSQLSICKAGYFNIFPIVQLQDIIGRY